MIQLMRSTFYNETETKKKLANFILQADRLSMGEQCREFEKNFAKKQEREYAVFVSSGSMANLILLQSLINLGRLEKGDCIGVSALTWATNIMPILQLGLKPLILDCEVAHLNISSKEVLKYKDEIKALFLTNVLGFSGDIASIKEICKDNNITLLEDNCESLGSKVSGSLLGNFGIASTFSTFVGHHISTIEGGFVCTDEKDMYDMLLMTRAHGWDRNLDQQRQNELRREHKIDDFFSRYTFYELAYNARPTEIQGFLGNIQIQYWDEIVERRENNFFFFQKAIRENSDFIPLDVEHMNIISNFAFPVVCKTEKLAKKYIKKFKESDVETRPIIAGDMTQQPFFRKNNQDVIGVHHKNATFIHKQGFYFPNNPELTEQDLAIVSKIINTSF